MKLAIDIIKNLLLPKLEKDSNFDNNKLNASFWENFTFALLDFETDAKPLYAAIYGLEPENAEKIISKLPAIYTAFINEMAENYVIGNEDAATKHLHQTKNTTFDAEVHYFKNLEKAIKKVERKRLKSELPKSYEKLTFELPEEDMEMAIKKKGREALKEKMNIWDEELEESSKVLQYDLLSDTFDMAGPIQDLEYAFPPKKETKIISLTWIKYAAAASIVFGVGFTIFSLFNNYNQKFDIADLIKTKDSTTIISNSGKGYTYSSSPSSKKEIIINYIDQSDKIASLEKIIKENEDINLRKYKKELKILISRENKYVFIDNELTFYREKPDELLLIALEKKSFYIKLDTTFYKIRKTSTPLSLDKETDKNIIDKLEKILLYNI